MNEMSEIPIYNGYLFKVLESEEFKMYIGKF